MSSSRLRWQDVGAAWTYVRGVSRGVARGHIFPPEGRLAVQEAPGGTVDPQPRLGPLARARREHRLFTEPEHTVPVPGLSRPLEILHLTDVHLRGDDAWVAELCERVGSLRPDLVAITGDIVAREWTRPAVERFLAGLPPAPLGRWAVMGNWEYWARATPHVWRPILAAHDVGLLIEARADLGPITLVGTDDLYAGQIDPERCLADLPPKPTVVLSHSPAAFPQLARPGVNLVLSGHSHAGQLRLPALGAFWVPKGTGPYIGGWYQQGTSWMYVGRGVGWSIAPLRMWCPPELAKIRLVPA